MGFGLSGAHCERRVQQQHSLLCPGRQTAIFRWGNAQICLQFEKNIFQRGGQGNAAGDAKAKPVGLPGPVIGVLADDHDFHLVKGRVQKAVEDQAIRGIDDLPACFFLCEKFFEL